MLSLNLPPYEIKIIEREGKRQIFDPLRKSYVALTPEEWVRQHFVNYLLQYKGYPSSLTANEVGITLNGMSRRCDTVIYDKNLKPRAIVEYKASSVKITKEVFAQISRYNLVLRVDYLIISNGLQHYCCKMDYANNSFTFMQDIPDYNTLCEA
jgi:type I site-specific restriction endonuclease